VCKREREREETEREVDISIFGVKAIAEILISK
jgi:hypothetical protein